METKTFKGIEKSKLLSIPDNELKEVLLAPNYTEYLKFGAIILAALVISSFFLDGSRLEASNAASSFEICHSNLYSTFSAGSHMRNSCDELFAISDANNLATEQEYVQYEVRQYEQDLSNPQNILRLTGAAAFLLLAIAALVKKQSPFFMTKISSQLQISSEEDSLVSANISGKTVKRWLLNTSGIMLRKFESGHFIVSFYNIDGGNRDDVAPSSERVVMDKTQADGFAAHLEGLKNVKARATPSNEILLTFK